MYSLILEPALVSSRFMLRNGASRWLLLSQSPDLGNISGEMLRSIKFEMLRCFHMRLQTDQKPFLCSQMEPMENLQASKMTVSRIKSKSRLEHFLIWCFEMRYQP